MTTLLWITLSGVLMSAIALVGSVTIFLRPQTLNLVVLPLVALAAGSLIGGAFFHMLPTAVEQTPDVLSVFVWTVVGFALFLAIEQLLHWHHCHRASSECKKPLGYLVLIGDGLHNLLGGMAIGGTFLIDIRLGATAWLVAAAHEVPQELGDFGVLIHAGWKRSRALLFNAASGLMFLLGGLIAYAASFRIDVAFLVPLAAGNFLYIGASDLVPEINKHHSAVKNVIHYGAFVVGLFLLWLLKRTVDS